MPLKRTQIFISFKSQEKLQMQIGKAAKHQAAQNKGSIFA